MRRLPPGAWVCALVCFLSSACWSLIAPPFQVTDEPDHFAYVQQLAETGRLPDLTVPATYSPEQFRILLDVYYFEMRRNPENHGISTPQQRAQLKHDLAARLSRRSNGGAGVAGAEPPLYYLLATIPYRLASHGNLLVRLQAVRLFSALLGGIAALFAYLFIREALPGTAWAWVPGGLAVALAPALGSRAGGVTPDALLIAVCAALFYCLARAFRGGLSVALAVALGALTAAGLETKLTFLGLVPGVGLALLVLAWRMARRSQPGAVLCLTIAVAIAVAPVALNSLLGLDLAQVGLDIVPSTPVGHGSLTGELSYIWQLYLPALPGMRIVFPGISTTRELWFNHGVGLYGWVDTFFPSWVDDLALIPVGLLGALGARALLGGRAALRPRLIETLVYLTMGLGVLVLVGGASYAEYPGFLTTYVNPRYLLPMLPLWGAGLALAARGGGRRWGPVIAVLIVVLVFAHDLFSQLLVISRYYYG